MGKASSILITLLLVVFARTIFAGVSDDPLLSRVFVNRLEVQADTDYPLTWDSNVWFGYDLNKIYLYSEGDAAKGEISSLNQFAYDRAFAAFWNFQIGVDFDTRATENQFWAVLAVQGLAPYFFETRAQLLVNDKAMGFRFEIEYEILITQRLILSPRIDAEAYTEDIPALQYGAGVSNIGLGLRLRFELVRELAPYIGVQWEKNFGNTRSYNSVNEFRALGGLRFWF